MQDLSRIHTPVLLRECVELIAPPLQEASSVFVDCTLGLAGHTLAVLEATRGRAIGIDRDHHALERACQRIAQAGYSERFTPVHAPFDQVDEALDSLAVPGIDVAFMDLGLSSLQIDQVDRGFTYMHDAQLDMRMDQSQSTTASTILATYSAQELQDIFSRYGQERFAGRIARAIVEEREANPLETSGQLSALIDRVIPKRNRPAGHPAKRVFQALRIEVNAELDKLAVTLPRLLLRLNVGGRLVVESYHSLEDRMVKQVVARGLKDDAPVGMPVVPEEALAYLSDLSNGAIKADEQEIAHNSRSASVRLRAVELIRPLPQRARTELQQLAYGDHASHTHRTTMRRK